MEPSVEPAAAPLPSLTAFLFESGLYVPYSLEGVDPETFVRFCHNPGPIDGFCIYCDAQTMFVNGYALPFYGTAKGTSGRQYETIEDYLEVALQQDVFRDRSYSAHLQCLKSKDHVYTYTWNVRGKVLRKTGQFPSPADLVLPRLNRFNKVLLASQRSELGRAIGLHAHGIGVGAFIYLRRVFSGLIDQARDEASSKAGWDNDAYEKERMAERIVRLSTHLPELLVRNAQIYGILSKGVHELTEEECLTHFDVVRNGIEIILDELLERRNRLRRAEEYTAAVQKLASELGDKSKE
jgi:hypothetical protein